MKNKVFSFLVLVFSLVLVLSVPAFAEPDSEVDIIDDIKQTEAESEAQFVEPEIVIDAAQDDAEEATDQSIETPDFQDTISFIYNSKEYKVIEISDENQLPEGFSFSTLDYENITVAAGEDQLNGRKVVIARDSEDNTKCFLYDSVIGFVPFIEIKTNANNIVPLPIDDASIPDGFVRDFYETNNGTIEALKNPDSFDEKDAFYLLYGLNENRECKWYWYDVKEGTLQRYRDNLSPEIEKPDDSPVEDEPGKAETENKFIKAKSENPLELKDNGKDKYAIAVFEKDEKDSWKMSKTFYYSSPAMFVIIVVLAMIINLVVLFTIILIINRARNRY